MAKQLATNLNGEVSTRIVTVYDDGKLWGEFRLVFINGEPSEIKVDIGTRVGTLPWKCEKDGLEAIENVLSTVNEAQLNWLGE